MAPRPAADAAASGRAHDAGRPRPRPRGRHAAGRPGARRSIGQAALVVLLAVAFVADRRWPRCPAASSPARRRGSLRRRPGRCDRGRRPVRRDRRPIRPRAVSRPGRLPPSAPIPASASAGRRDRSAGRPDLQGQAGDTLIGIAAKFGTTVKAHRRAQRHHDTSNLSSARSSRSPDRRRSSDRGDPAPPTRRRSALAAPAERRDEPARA